MQQLITITNEKLIRESNCNNCWLTNYQQVPAVQFWTKGFPENWQHLCRSCYREKKIKWIIWEEQQRQAIDKFYERIIK